MGESVGAAGFAEVNVKPFTGCECRVFSHSGTGKLVSPPPIAGGKATPRDAISEYRAEAGRTPPIAYGGADRA